MTPKTIYIGLIIAFAFSSCRTNRGVNNADRDCVKQKLHLLSEAFQSLEPANELHMSLNLHTLELPSRFDTIQWDVEYGDKFSTADTTKAKYELFKSKIRNAVNLEGCHERIHRSDLASVWPRAIPDSSIVAWSIQLTPVNEDTCQFRTTHLKPGIQPCRSLSFHFDDTWYVKFVAVFGVYP